MNYHIHIPNIQRIYISRGADKFFGIRLNTGEIYWIDSEMLETQEQVIRLIGHFLEQVGFKSAWKYFNGQIKELRIYPQEVSDSQKVVVSQVNRSDLQQENKIYRKKAVKKPNRSDSVWWQEKDLSKLFGDGWTDSK